MTDGVALVHAIQDVFLDGSVTHRLSVPRGGRTHR